MPECQPPTMMHAGKNLALPIRQVIEWKSDAYSFVHAYTAIDLFSCLCHLSGNSLTRFHAWTIIIWRAKNQTAWANHIWKLLYHYKKKMCACILSVRQLQYLQENVHLLLWGYFQLSKSKMKSLEECYPLKMSKQNGPLNSLRGNSQGSLLFPTVHSMNEWAFS